MFVERIWKRNPWVVIDAPLLYESGALIFFCWPILVKRVFFGLGFPIVNLVSMTPPSSLEHYKLFAHQVISCSSEVQLKRLMERDNSTKNEVSE